MWWCIAAAVAAAEAAAFTTFVLLFLRPLPFDVVSSPPARFGAIDRSLHTILPLFSALSMFSPPSSLSRFCVFSIGFLQAERERSEIEAEENSREFFWVLFHGRFSSVFRWCLGRRTRARGKVGDRGKRSRGCEVRRRSVWGGLCSRRRRRSRRPFPRDVVRGGCGARVKESALEVRDSVRSRGGVGSACPFALQVTTNHPHQFANMLPFPRSPFGCCCCCCVVINTATTL